MIIVLIDENIFLTFSAFIVNHGLTEVNNKNLNIG